MSDKEILEYLRAQQRAFNSEALLHQNIAAIGKAEAFAEAIEYIEKIIKARHAANIRALFGNIFSK